jgi:uncharacterized Zn finger protein
MIYHVSDCCGTWAVYEIDEATDEAVWRCDECGEVCKVRVLPDKDEIAPVKAERRADR